MSTILGYEITENLYESHNSLVYRGCRKGDSQPVILKMLKQDYPSPEKVARFKLEYEITRSLNPSPGSAQTLAGVVAAYSLEVDQGQWMMILEDFGGEALAQLIQRRRLTLAEFLSLAVAIVDSLSQIHQQNIIHKDINPSNIVLNPKTGQLKLIDFGISTRLSRENQTLRNPNLLEGTLAYISPEQTGRMNRGLDYRTDFYSLGVTFYELLTGQLPFPTIDVLELVHCHIAKHPTPPHELNPNIPRPLSEVVLKLMAKNAEDRYQSPYSLKADLETCLRQWQTMGRIEPFPLRQHDVSSRFQIPQKLYGREREIELLLAAFERVSQGACELMIVSGYAGIGKSALVQEIHKPITRQRGYFITGKFDQLQRDIPYASLLQAFGLLVRQLLTESEQEIAAWRERLLGALGPNGQVMIEVIPELELIIGPQPKVPDLPPTEAQNRFNHVLQNFIKVFAQPEHPLVIFLDDLQWADGASLKLIEVLMTGQESLYLFLIGAYRDNEVGEGHPSKLTLEVLKESRATVNHISLCPLARPYIVQLIADTLHHPPMEVEPLAELILAKTEGNPFFVNEFLKSLYTEKLLIFDFQQTGWRWNLRQIQAQRITDNVVELMAAKVRKLSEETQAILELAACIGNQFDLQTLAIVSEKTPQETAANLWAALVEGLILPLGDAYKLVELNVQGLVEELTVEYKFAHDQVQQATYFLIPESERQAVHHQIGQLLLRETSPAEREQKIFEIVNQLNLGRGLIQQQEEQEKLAELNLRAGQKAKAAAAFKPAFNYFHTGLTLLGDNSWGRRYDLTLGLFVESAEAAYLIADFDQMEQLIEVVLQEARTLLDKVKVYEIKIQAYIAQNKLHEAIKTALPVLKSLGVQFPEKPTTAHILRGLIETKWALTGKRVENLINLPAMSDPIKRATMQIMNTLISATYLTVPNLFPLIIFKQVSLSVKYGNTPESAKAYAMYGVILYEVTKNIESSYRFGQLALSLLERFDAREVKAKVFMGVYIFLNPWRAHFREILEPLREGYQSGLDAGDLEFAAYLLSACPVFAYHAGKNLVELEPELASVIEAIAQMKQARTGYVPRIYRQIALNLLGHSQTPSRLNGESYDDEQMPPLHHDANDITEHLYMSQLFLSYLFQEYAQAIEYAARAEERLEGFKGMALTVIFHFYDSLAQLAVFSASSSSTQKRILKKVTANQKKMKKWAKYAPMNFLHKFYLVEAEQAQVLGNDSQARDYYDQAIALAQENEYLNEEALAHELAAKFYLARGQNHVARHYLRDAHYTYLHWGATAKVKDLEARYPQFLAPARSSHELPTLTTPTTDTGETASSLLDLSSVLKASQAISGEIVLDKLLATLMKIVIENAGAQRGYLLLDKEGTWAIEAEGTVIENEAEVTALQSIPVGQVANLPHAIVNFVARTKESVVLNDAAGEGIFTQDPYIIQNQPKSILCSPLINQGKLNGILYLENNLTTGAFTWERQEVLNLLSGQAAISIENARLYTRQVELTHSASRFVPQEFLQFLGKDSIRQVNLGDQAQQDMTILVSDIRSFTTLSETMTPQENFDFVNAYLGQVSPIIRQHHGFIAKYMGDGMMAVFPRLTEDALSAAIETLKHVARYNVERQQQGQAPLQIGIGIHTGPVMLGTVGEAQRMQLDLLSDVVNVTVRLEGLSKLYGVALIVSAEALMRLEDPTQYHMRFLGKTPVKGRQETLSVFEVFDGDPAEIVTLKLQTKSDFEKALSLYYDWKFAEAKVLFEQALQSYPGDKAPQLYLKQMGQFTDYRVLFDEARVEGLMDR